MPFWDDVGWITTGGYRAFESGVAANFQKKKSEKVSSIVRSLTDEDFERKLREEIYSASPEKFNETWCRIEEFKRDNLHLTKKHLSTSYWMHVGKERFPFTRSMMCVMLNKNKLSKSDEKILSMYRGWTITLLMNTYGKYSIMEATRIAFRQVYGAGSDVWTREFG